MRPRAGVGIECTEPIMRLAVRGQVRQVHVVIALGQERIVQRSKDSRFIPAKVVRENEVQSSSRLRLIFIMPVRVVPGPAVLDLLHGEPE